MAIDLPENASHGTNMEVEGAKEALFKYIYFFE